MINLRIGIIGAGSIGSLFGGYLASIKSDKYSTEVFLFCRKGHAEAINENGLILRTSQEGGENRNIKDIKAFDSLTKFEDFQSKKKDKKSFDFLFLTTKAYDIETAVNEYKNLIDQSRRFVILQNGVGNEDVIKENVLSEKIIRAVTVNGVTFEDAGCIVHTGTGLTKVGYPFKKALDLRNGVLQETQEDLTVLSEVLSESGLETIVVADIVKECWEKVFVNVGINAFGALTRLKNGKLLEAVGLKDLMGEAIDEAVKVAKYKKINLSKKDFAVLAYDVAKKTAENKNSMLQDILKGKNTEIDYINGRILSYARELGLKAPINELLTFLIKGLERSER